MGKTFLCTSLVSVSCRFCFGLGIGSSSPVQTSSRNYIHICKNEPAFEWFAFYFNRKHQQNDASLANVRQVKALMTLIADYKPYTFPDVE